MNFTPNLANSPNYVQIALGKPTALDITGSITVLTGYMRTGDQYSGFGRLLCRTNGSTGDDWGVAISPEASGSYVRWRVNGDSLEGSTALVQDQFYNIATVFDAANSTRFTAIDGVIDASDGVTGPLSIANDISVGANSGSDNRAINGKIYYTVIFDRALTLAEINTFNSDPYAIMAVAASGTTGAAAITEQGDTVTATGGIATSPDRVGTADIQEAGDTVTAIGTVPVTTSGVIVGGQATRGQPININMTDYIAGPSTQYVEAWYIEGDSEMQLTVTQNTDNTVTVIPPTFLGSIELRKIDVLAEGVAFIADPVPVILRNIAYQGWSTMLNELDGNTSGTGESHAVSLHELTGEMYRQNSYSDYSDSFTFLGQGSEFINVTDAITHVNNVTSDVYVISVYGGSSGIVVDPATASIDTTGWIDRVIDIADRAAANGMVPVVFQAWGNNSIQNQWDNAKLNTDILESRRPILIIRTAEMVQLLGTMNPDYVADIDAVGGKYSTPVTTLFSGSTTDTFHGSYAMSYLNALATTKALTGISAADNTFVIPTSAATGTNYGMSSQFIADIKTAVDQIQTQSLI